MGLFGLFKIKIFPNDFVKNELDKIFSTNFIDEEKKNYENISKEILVFQEVNFNKYLREKQNVIYNLFQIAWDRNTPHDIFIGYSSIMFDDPRVKMVNTGVYDMCLSKAQAAGMDTFGYISSVFIAQIIPKNVDIADFDYAKLYKLYGSEFTSLYIYYENLIKKHKFVINS